MQRRQSRRSYGNASEGSRIQSWEARRLGREVFSLWKNRPRGCLNAIGVGSGQEWVMLGPHAPQVQVLIHLPRWSPWFTLVLKPGSILCDQTGTFQRLEEQSLEHSSQKKLPSSPPLNLSLLQLRKQRLGEVDNHVASKCRVSTEARVSLTSVLMVSEDTDPDARWTQASVSGLLLLSSRSWSPPSGCAESQFSLAEVHSIEGHSPHASRLCPRTPWPPSKKSDPEATVTAPLEPATVDGPKPLRHLPACGRMSLCNLGPRRPRILLSLSSLRKRRGLKLEAQEEGVRWGSTKGQEEQTVGRASREGGTPRWQGLSH